jgi:small-conductance mechanosensitive channel
MITGNLFGIEFSAILGVLVILAVALSLERVFTTYLSKFAKRTKMDPAWILSISAIAGAALGFASQKTLGNFLAGLFLLAARPFKVGDLVRLGTVEGVVQEVTINYTKVLTIGNNTVSISNLQILDRDITNYVYESRRNFSLYCYTFEIGFDHTVSTDKLATVFNEVFERFVHTLPKPPFANLTRSDAFVRVYTIYLYVEHPEDVFTLRPQISAEVFKRWDVERSAAKSVASTKEDLAKIVQQQMKKQKEKNDEEEGKNRSQSDATG